MNPAAAARVSVRIVGHRKPVPVHAGKTFSIVCLCLFVYVGCPLLLFDQCGFPSGESFRLRSLACVGSFDIPQQNLAGNTVKDAVMGIDIQIPFSFSGRCDTNAYKPVRQQVERFEHFLPEYVNAVGLKDRHILLPEGGVRFPALPQLSVVAHAEARQQVTVRVDRRCRGLFQTFSVNGSVQFDQDRNVVNSRT